MYTYIKYLIKTVTSVYHDFRSFNKKELSFISLLIIFIIIFSIINFDSFYDKNQSLYQWNNYKKYPKWRRNIFALSGVASITGSLMVITLTKCKLSTYFFGIINNIIFGIYAYAFGYAGDAQTCILFLLPMQFYGIHAWENNMGTDDKLIVERIKLKTLIMTIIAFMIIVIIFYFEIPAISKAITGSYIYENNQVAHIFDSVANAFTIMAQILALNRYLESWVFWILCDLFRIPMYAGISHFGVSINILIMIFVYIVNSCFGFRYWIKANKKQKIVNTENNINNINNSDNNV